MLLAFFTLLCAICPLGLPASQKLGPAFNPANEIVTVRPEAKLPAARATTEAPDPRGPLPIALAATLPVAIMAPPSVVVALATPDPAPLAGATPFAARAPPART